MPTSIFAFMAAPDEPTVYLVSGANRGIGMQSAASAAEGAHANALPGLAIVTLLASRADAVVFAGARNPDGADKLHALAKAHPGRVHIVKLVSADRANNDAAVEEIKRTVGRLNVVIANAGISDCFKDALAISPEEMTRHFEASEMRSQPTGIAHAYHHSLDQYERSACPVPSDLPAPACEQSA